MELTIVDLADPARETGLEPQMLRALRGDAAWGRVASMRSRGRAFSLGEGRWVIIPRWCLRPFALVEERVGSFDEQERRRFFVEDLELLPAPDEHAGWETWTSRRVHAVYSDRSAALNGLVAAAVQSGQAMLPQTASTLEESGSLVLEPNVNDQVVQRDITGWLRTGQTLMVSAKDGVVQVTGGGVQAQGDDMERALAEWWWAHVWQQTAHQLPNRNRTGSGVRPAGRRGKRPTRQTACQPPRAKAPGLAPQPERQASGWTPEAD